MHTRYVQPKKHEKGVSSVVSMLECVCVCVCVCILSKMLLFLEAFSRKE